MLRIDDIPQQVADDIQGLRLDVLAEVWYNGAKKGGEAMFGAIYGDIIGSYYEIHCTKDYNFEFNKDSFFTDDSVLIAAVCKAILNNPTEISK